MSLEKRNIELHNIRRDARKKAAVKNVFHTFKNKKHIFKFLKTVQLRNKYNQTEDENFRMLTRDLGKARIAVYSCIVADYDHLIEPSFLHTNVDYFMFSDKNFYSSIWQKKDLPEKIKKLKNPVLMNRYIKLHPFEFFPEYDYVLYIDGNIEVASDVSGLINGLGDYGIAMHQHFKRDCVYKEAEALNSVGKGDEEKMAAQLKKYKEAGLPKNFGLAEVTIILSSTTSPMARSIFEAWWAEFLSSESYRDQLAFPYVIWKNNVDINQITTLGRNLRLSGKFFMHQHK